MRRSNQCYRKTPVIGAYVLILAGLGFGLSCGCGNAERPVEPIEVSPVAKTDTCLITPLGAVIGSGEGQLDDIQFVARSRCNQLTRLHATRVPELTNMHFASGLVMIQSLELAYNENLQSLEGLQSVTEMAQLTLNYNESLKDLSALRNIRLLGGRTYGSIKGSLYISANPTLESLDGLQNVESVQSIKIAANESLRSISALHGVEGLESVTILNNANLPRCRIDTFLESLPTRPENVTIENNGAGECER